MLPGLRKAENPLIVARELNAAGGASQSSKIKAWACLKDACLKDPQFFCFPFTTAPNPKARQMHVYSL